MLLKHALATALTLAAISSWPCAGHAATAKKPAKPAASQKTKKPAAKAAPKTGKANKVMKIVVPGVKPQPLPATAGALNQANITAKRAHLHDATRLLEEVSGLGVITAGGLSALPVLHGLADDRIRVKVDGLDIIAACANHMNSPLSTVDPASVASITAFAGITPVSVGGDSIGGAIVVQTGAAQFARPGQGMQSSVQTASNFRSNGNAFGANLTARLSGENMSLRYTAAMSQSGNYRSAKSFKPGALATFTTAGTHWIAGEEVASTAYKGQNHTLSGAWRAGRRQVDLKLAHQHLSHQSYPNQHMDMTGNKRSELNLAWTGQQDWGSLQARLIHETTKHDMDFYEDKLYWYHASRTVPGMPMHTRAKNTNLSVKAGVTLSKRSLLRVGGEFQRYRLDDWWPPSYGLSGSVKLGGMQPDTFINLNKGKRDRLELFGEWEAAWTPKLLTQLGLRAGQVSMNTGPVQGYNTTMANYLAESTAFNAAKRKRTDENLDLTALFRVTPGRHFNWEGGYARKTRSPSLYERYTWSTGGMAMTMNNWLNDGNGYVGNLNLKPEVSHTLSVSGDWHDASQQKWGFRATPYLTHVKNFIDARCLLPPCSTTSFVYLTLANESARIYGLDLSGFFPLAHTQKHGDFIAKGVVNVTTGKNRANNQSLYNIMPLNGKFTVEHRLGRWTNALETQLVAPKNKVSAVRNEIKTAGYGLLHLRGGYEKNRWRVDFGVENVLNRQHDLPLGGAYIGQGTTMSLNGTGAPWGVKVPGPGRSFYAGVTVKF